ncbi:hypothetical protein FHX76_002996 [Lysinibacter cavernae]|uniref:DUF3499 family protein n=2 Tax=Lysinibacter cavernae TaxID=1640652 RepID=A0A7X5R3S4_9MICO|nr:hypothetical protein [Lysinibacter cavernae]
MAIGPLSPVADPNSYDLCAFHGDKMRPPTGWQLFRHAILGGVDLLPAEESDAGVTG